MRLSLADRLVGGVALFAVLTGAALAGGAYFNKRSAERRDFAMAITGGNPERAEAIIMQFGCGGCHTIPGVTGASGQVGPPLKGISARIYLGGVLANTPDNMIRWLLDPPAIDPLTAMPATGISEQQARDIAAYLYQRS